MRIRIKGEEVDLQVQQYETGLEVCIYYLDGILKEQFELDTTKELFLEYLHTNPEIAVL